MATHSSATELRKMPVDELRKEIDRRRLDTAKERLSVGMQTEKDTAHFRRSKRELARMLTVLVQLSTAAQSELKPKRKTSRLPAPSRSRS